MIIGQQKIRIKEQEVPKFIEHSGCYEVMSNDDSMKIVLHKVTVMDASMESGFYSTETWIKEDEGWIKTNNIQNYSSKEAFIQAISGSEDFTKALRDYENYIKY